MCGTRDEEWLSSRCIIRHDMTPKVSPGYPDFRFQDDQVYVVRLLGEVFYHRLYQRLERIFADDAGN